MKQLIMAIRAAIILFLWLILLSIPNYKALNAQNWEWSTSIGSQGIETGDAIIVEQENQFIVGGTFSESWELNGTTITPIGEKDIFIYSKNDLGNSWVIHGGSILDDEIVGIEKDGNENLYIAGSYWQSATFGGDTIFTQNNPKGLFLLKLDSAGNEIWLKQFDGADLKDVTDLKIDNENNIYLCGYFDQFLAFDTTTINANGDTDLFLLKFNSDGGLIYAQNSGYIGDTRAMALDVNALGEVAIGGFYNDTTIIANDTLPANTTDRDVFIAKFDTEGSPVWGRKAGGVHDDELTNISFTNNNEIIAAGYLVGVMSLGSGISIQSSNGNSDIYLLKYDTEGTPIQARALGGNLIQQTTHLLLKQNQILVSGIFQGEMELDGVQLSAGNMLGGFIASFDGNFNTNWALSINGNGNIFPNVMSIDAQGQINLVGSFFNSVQFDDQELLAIDGFDVFIARLTESLTSLETNKNTASNFEIFPNPADEIIQIKTILDSYDIAIINAEGKLMLTEKNTAIINISGLPAGMYTVRIQSGEKVFTQKLVKE